MFVKLNERVCINLCRITKTRIDQVEGGFRVRFYEAKDQIAKSHAFDKLKDAEKWLNKILKSAK